MGVIYKITSPSNKLYVGKTYDLRKRINSHKCSVKYGKNLLLHNSIRKYGWDAHILEVLEEVADEIIDEREIFWIAELKTYCYENKDGMNMTKGGDGQRSTWMHKTELRKYFSDKFSGSGNPFFGKTHPKEWRIKKSKEVSEYNKKHGRTIPKWGAEKGLNIVRRPVICYDSLGNYHSEYLSVTDASNFLNLNASSVSAVCNGKRNHTKGFIFRYKDSQLKVSKVDTKNGVKRQVLSLDSDYNVICKHPSSAEASKFWGIPKTTINRAAMYNWLVPIRTGHVFIYTDLYEKIDEDCKQSVS